MHRTGTSWIVALVGGLAPLTAQEQVHCSLRIRDVAEHLAEVTADFPVHGRQTLELFLPVWSTGFYREQNYHENIVDFAASVDDIAGATEARRGGAATSERAPTTGAQVVALLSHHSLTHPLSSAHRSPGRSCPSASA